MTWLDEVITAVRDHDAARPRSRQTQIGWSQAGACRAWIGYKLAGEWPSDIPDTWAAQRGTAVHTYLTHILAGPGVRVEVPCSYRGIPGTADLVEPDGVTDIKTTRLATARLWATRPAALWQKRVQVQGYAAGLVDAGDLPADARVRILAVPIDGTFADWWVWEEPFDRAVADEGANRIAYVAALRAGGGVPPRDQPWAWCRQWCEYFSLCRDPVPAEAEPVTDPELAAAVTGYGELGEQIKTLEATRGHYADLIRGLDGTAGPWRVSMTKPGTPGRVLDEDAVTATYASLGEPVPWLDKDPASPKLRVTRAGAGE